MGGSSLLSTTGPQQLGGSHVRSEGRRKISPEFQNPLGPFAARVSESPTHMAHSCVMNPYLPPGLGGVFFKVFIEFVTILLLFFVWAFQLEACEITVP